MNLEFYKKIFWEDIQTENCLQLFENHSPRVTNIIKGSYFRGLEERYLDNLREIELLDIKDYQNESITPT